MSTVYDFSVKAPNGEDIPLETYKGKALVIVNTASKCGLASQFKELEALYQKYKDEGVTVLGFPSNQFMNQEPLKDDEMKEACEVNFGVTFPLFKKINVNGKDAHPLYKHLKAEQKGVLSADIKWNFTKFLIDQSGNVVKRYSPQTSPIKLEDELEELLKS